MVELAKAFFGVLIKPYKNLSITLKIVLPIACITLLTVVASGMSYLHMQEMMRETNYLQQVIGKALKKALDADKDLYQMQVAERAYLSSLQLNLAEDVSNDFLKLYRKNKEQSEERIQDVKDNVDLADVVRNLKIYDTKIREYYQISNQAFTLAQQGNHIEAMTVSLLKGDPVFDAARDAMDDAANYLDDVNDDGRDYLAELPLRSINTQLAVSSLLIALCIFVGFTLPAFLAKPIKSLTMSIQNIAMGDGDLKQRLSYESNDELGQLADAYNSLISKIHGSISSVVEVSELLANVSDTTLNLSQRGQSLLSQQSQHLAEVVSVVDELSDSVKSVSTNAEQSAEETNEVSRSAEVGLNHMKESKNKVGNLSESLNRSETIIGDLENEAKNISSVLDVIRGIAEQTNLLALNAAIEAARAGEQGRGFAVVADEVRSLAARTQESTQDIQSMIETLQKGVNETVSSINRDNQLMQTVVDEVNEVANTFEQIQTDLAQVSNKAMAIAQSTENQSQSIHSASRSLSDVNLQMTESTQSSEETAAVARDLASHIQELNNITQRFSV